MFNNGDTVELIDWPPRPQNMTGVLERKIREGSIENEFIYCHHSSETKLIYKDEVVWRSSTPNNIESKIVLKYNWFPIKKLLP